MRGGSIIGGIRILAALSLATVLLALPLSAALTRPSNDASEPNRVVGGELLLFSFDADDRDGYGSGANVLDRSGRGDVARLVKVYAPAPWVGGSPAGGSDALAASVAYVESFTTPSSVRDLARSEFTLAAWARADSSTCATQVIVALPQMRLVARCATIYWEEVRITAITAIDDGTVASLALGTLPVGRWSHVAAVGTTAGVQLYVDGVAGPLVARPAPAAGGLAEGVYSVGDYPHKALASFGVPQAPFQGALDEVRVLSRALSQEEVQSVRTGPYLHLNVPPVASAGPDPEAACTGPFTAVALDGSSSRDPEGDALSFAWASSVALAGVAQPTGLFPVGATPASLTVSDGEAAASDAALVRVHDRVPPVVAITSPSGGGVHAAGHVAPAGDVVLVVGEWTFSADASDVCGAVIAVRFTIDGTTIKDEEAPWTATWAPAGLGVSYETLSVAAEDEHGNVSPPVTLDVTTLALSPQLPTRA